MCFRVILSIKGLKRWFFWFKSQILIFILWLKANFSIKRHQLLQETVILSIKRHILGYFCRLRIQRRQNYIYWLVRLNLTLNAFCSERKGEYRSLNIYYSTLYGYVSLIIWWVEGILFRTMETRTEKSISKIYFFRLNRTSYSVNHI